MIDINTLSTINLRNALKGITVGMVTAAAEKTSLNSNPCLRWRTTGQ